VLYTIVAVKDRALDAYGRPIFVHTQGQAIRSFQDEINRNAPDNEMFRHPEDYDLYFIGTFDDKTGNFENCPPLQIGIGKQLKTTGA
jgi:hypothetical protein